MRLKISLLLILLIANVAIAGDPLDTNDRHRDNTVVTVSADTPGCDDAERYPACEPCWTKCYFAMMAQIWCDGNWDNDNW